MWGKLDSGEIGNSTYMDYLDELPIRTISGNIYKNGLLLRQERLKLIHFSVTTYRLCENRKKDGRKCFRSSFFLCGSGRIRTCEPLKGGQLFSRQPPSATRTRFLVKVEIDRNGFTVNLHNFRGVKLRQLYGFNNFFRQIQECKSVWPG